MAAVLVAGAASAQQPTRAVVQPGAAGQPASAVQPSAPALPAAVPAPAPAFAAVNNDSEALVREAAGLEKTDCEAAWLRYQDASGSLGRVNDKSRASQLGAIISNKMEKLDACYRACQPTDRQRQLLGAARSASDQGEQKRAIQITRRLLAGKNDKCSFWSDARAFLRTLPQQAEQMDTDDVDPCALSDKLSRDLDDTRAAIRAEREALALTAMRKPIKLDDLVDLYRAMDSTRMRAGDLRELVLDCEKAYKPLAQDSDALRASFVEAQQLVLGTYQGQLASLGKKIRVAEKQLEDQDKLLESHAAEQERLKKDLDQMTAFNEELYNDLFSLGGAEAVSFSVQVEGKRIDQPLEEVHALLASEGKILDKLNQSYPEFFKDGVNLEGLKRKKLVLEKIQQMLQRFGPRAAGKPQYARAMSEIDATVQMLDKTIAANDRKAPLPATKEEGSTLPWFLGGSTALLVAGLTVWRIRKSGPR